MNPDKETGDVWLTCLSILIMGMAYSTLPGVDVPGYWTTTAVAIVPLSMATFLYWTMEGDSDD